MAESTVPITAGSGTSVDTFTDASGHHRQVVIVGDRGGYKGRASTWRTQGRAAAQTLFTIHNATGSTVKVLIHRIVVDFTCTVVTAVTVPPPMVRLWKITALPTGGTALTKVPEDSSLSSSSSVTITGDTSADNTLSGTALAITRPAGTIVTQEFVSRLITAAGYEPTDRLEFLPEDAAVVLNALEGLAVYVDLSGSPAGTNPATYHWLVSCRWEEFTP